MDPSTYSVLLQELGKVIFTSSSSRYLHHQKWEGLVIVLIYIFFTEAVCRRQKCSAATVSSVLLLRTTSKPKLTAYFMDCVLYEDNVLIPMFVTK